MPRSPSIPVIEGILDGLASKEVGSNSGDTGDSGVIPVLGRSPGGGNGNILQHSCLGNSMDRGAWQAIVHWGHKVRHDWAQTEHMAYHNNTLLFILVLFIITILPMNIKHWHLVTLEGIKSRVSNYQVALISIKLKHNFCKCDYHDGRQ